MTANTDDLVKQHLLHLLELQHDLLQLLLDAHRLMDQSCTVTKSLADLVCHQETASQVRVRIRRHRGLMAEEAPRAD